MRQKRLATALLIIFIANIFWPFFALAQTGFNPNLIITDSQLQDFNSWTNRDIQNFLDARGSYLRNYSTSDASGTIKTAAEIIYDSARAYQVNPKFLLVTLQKEQSLITDDSPTQKQLDWATGYAICDSCSMDDPKLQSKKGFFNQVENAAGLMRWYYDNSDKSFVKKKDQSIFIDNTPVVPQSWATAFLYTYTPHLHGNQNFWRIWNTWFGEIYPDGSLLKNASSSEIYLIADGKKRKFANMAAFVSRYDPKLAILTPETELSNYQDGAAISLSNYSILKTASGGHYLLDNDTLRPFASTDVVRQLGYNPDEIIEVTAEEIAGFAMGKTITAESQAPLGVIYQVTDAYGENFYLLKDGELKPIVDRRIIDVNFKNLKIEKHARTDLAKFNLNPEVIKYRDGTLLRSDLGGPIYVVALGEKRKITDNETFRAFGYDLKNVITVPDTTLGFLKTGEPLYLNASLLSAREKFLGDSAAAVEDLFKTDLPAYLVAEFPSGRILAGKDIDTPRAMASLTKLLAANEVMENNIDLKKSVVYDSKIHASEGNPLALVDGEKLINKDILTAGLVGSINNLARMFPAIAGYTEYGLVDSVNNRLRQWGADNTVVSDVTGLDNKNVSSPRDLLKIFTKILKNESLKEMLFTTKYTFKETVNKNKIANHTVKNTNTLIDVNGRNYRILASKTGYTDAAGANLIMLVEGRKDKKQYIVLTIGNSDTKNRFDEPDKLARWVITENGDLAGKKAPVAASAYHFDKNLKNGDNNEDVRQLQILLKKLGYFTYATATGKFGAATQEAVIRFQKAKKLPTVGTVGPATRAILNKL